MKRQHCPLCTSEVAPHTRFSDYLCNSCLSEAADRSGRKIKFFSASAGKGIGAYYADSNGKEEYPGPFYVKGNPCKVERLPFGKFILRPDRAN